MFSVGRDNNIKKNKTYFEGSVETFVELSNVMSPNGTIDHEN